MIRPANESEGSGLDPFIDAYESAQARDGRAELVDYLPAPDHPLYPAVLCELVRVDLEYGWMRGRPRRLEDYRADFPALFRDRELLRQAAFEEWRLRRQAGEDPDPADYRRRFGVEVPIDTTPAGSFEEATRLYREHRGDDPTSLDDALDSYLGPPEHTNLIRELHDADPREAGRVADALTRLPEPGTVFAGFRLIRELGRGAFGRVYLARQGDLADRLVALKVSAERPSEARVLAQLQHTHVVPIYSAHKVGPLQAVCMPFFGATTLGDVTRELRARDAPPDSGAALVDTLTSRLAGTELDPPKPPPPATAALRTLRGLGYVQAVLWIGTRLADGLAHAHERGIVHRDLKPANVLLTDEGQPMLLDFNLAADTKLRGTASAALVGGTLPYMAPEVLHSLWVGPASTDARGDLYALGLILFELLTGRHPFPIRRGPADEVLPLMIEDRRGPLPRPRESNPTVSPATESIVRRCLEPDPARRYQDARQLLDDLQRQLDDRPLKHAPEPSPRERFQKWARRHPRLSSATSLGVAATVLIAGLVAGFAYRQRHFGPVAANLAFRQLADDHEVALVHLLDPAGDPVLWEEGIDGCHRALARYNILDSPSWLQSRLVGDLPAEDQAKLRVQVGELLILWARELARQASGADPARRAELVHTALRHNALAESCYGPGAVPRLLWVQRAALSQLAGDDAGARRARELAATTPIHSAREYALLTIEDPDGARSGDAPRALAEASRRDSRDFSLWMLLGECLALRTRLSEAEDCFNLANVLRPHSPWPYFQRGLVELERKEYEPARLDFDRALQLRPDFAPAYVDRAFARMGQLDDAGAINDLNAALDRGATQTRIFFIRARARDRLGDADGAERDRAEGLRRTPSDVESWVARGLARLKSDPKGALADFEAALTLDPRSRSALQNKSNVLSERLGRAEEAIPILDRAVAMYPDFVPARVGRGVLLARLGRWRAARHDAEEARRRDPSGETTFRVACIYALTSKDDPADRPRALRMLATALGQDAAWLDVARTDPDLDPLRDHAEFRNLLLALADRSGPGS